MTTHNPVQTVNIRRGVSASAPPCRVNPQDSARSCRTICAFSTSTVPMMTRTLGPPMDRLLPQYSSQNTSPGLQVTGSQQLSKI